MNAEPTPVSPSGEDPEADWLRDTYRPNAPNLTLRAAVFGALIGAVMCASNIYVFFKTGWSMGVTITACLLAFALFKGLQAAKLVRRPLTVLENNALTTVASGAGFMTAGGNMAAYGALVMIISAAAHPDGATTAQAAAEATGVTLPETRAMIIWFACISALGVFAAIPIKRQLINRDGLAFPTGIATATTIRTIHAHDVPEPGSQLPTTWATASTPPQPKARDAEWLGLAALFGAVVALLRDGLKWVPESVAAPFSLAGYSLAKWTIAMKVEVILIGGGALMSLRTGLSMIAAAIVCYTFIAPMLFAKGLIAAVSYKAIIAWTLWPGAAMLVGAGLTSFALDYKSLARAFSGLTSRKAADSSAIDAIEAPGSWFPFGFAVLGPVVVYLMTTLFDIPLWAAMMALPLSLVMGFIAARVTGETDITPTKALGPVTQMAYGVMNPGNITGNIMSANVTGGIGLHAADLLTTLKTSWLLGAKPRHQVYAQLIGVAVGAAVVAPAFSLIIPDPTMLGSETWPAPSCTVWKGVSQAFSGGLGALHPTVIYAIVVGLALGIGLTLLEKVSPTHIKRWLPSANGIGLAMVVPASNSFAMGLGAIIAAYLRARKLDKPVVPVASGLIAGESLMGVAIALTPLVVSMWHKLFG